MFQEFCVGPVCGAWYRIFVDFVFFCIKAHCTVQVKVNAFFFDSETHAKDTKAK